MLDVSETPTTRSTRGISEEGCEQMDFNTLLEGIAAFQTKWAQKRVISRVITPLLGLKYPS